MLNTQTEFFFVLFLSYSPILCFLFFFHPTFFFCFFSFFLFKSVFPDLILYFSSLLLTLHSYFLFFKIFLSILPLSLFFSLPFLRTELFIHIFHSHCFEILQDCLKNDRLSDYFSLGTQKCVFMPK